MYDLIIVGAGPAGSTMALAAAEAGLRVLLVDKSHFPRDKVCGDFLPPLCIRILKRFGLFDRVLEQKHSLIKRMSIYTAGECLQVGGLSFVTSRRAILDNILFQEAKARVDTREGLKVKDVLTESGQVVGIRGIREDGESCDYSAKVVAGADGSNSVVAHRLGILHGSARHWGVAVRGYYRGLRVPTDEIQLFGFGAMPGYFWVFPVDSETANAGCGLLCSKSSSQKTSLADLPSRIMKAPSLADRFSGAEPVTDVRGWRLPLGHSRRTMHGNGFILLGDAAGLVDPLWGDGIDTAMLSGVIGANVVSTVCKGTDYRADKLRDYSDGIRKRLGSRFTFNRVLRSAAYLESYLLPFLTPARLLRVFYFRRTGTITEAPYWKPSSKSGYTTTDGRHRHVSSESTQRWARRRCGRGD